MVEQVKAKHGLTVHLDTLSPIHVASEPLKAFLYKGVQEMLFNVVKHAGVREAGLRLRRANGHLWLCVSDKGRGFDPQELGKTAGFRLLSVRERIELLGGRMRIKSAPGKGSVFVISVPDPGGEHPRHNSARNPTKPRCPLAWYARDARNAWAASGCGCCSPTTTGSCGKAWRPCWTKSITWRSSGRPATAGDEATRQIEKHLPNTRVIALSMFEDGHVSRRMHSAGAETYLSKTGLSEELLAAIRANL